MAAEENNENFKEMKKKSPDERRIFIVRTIVLLLFVLVALSAFVYSFNKQKELQQQIVEQQDQIQKLQDELLQTQTDLKTAVEKSDQLKKNAESKPKPKLVKRQKKLSTVKPKK